MFVYNIKSIAKKLMSDYDKITKQIEHSGVQGTVREDLIKNYIKGLIPNKYSISQGIIIDSNQKQSKQQDFIIYDGFNSSSLFKTESIDFLPIESVYATIEVKSVLDKTKLKDCIDNIQSVRELQKELSLPEELAKQVRKYPIGIVFAYTSKTSLQTLQENFFEFNKSVPKEHQISLICVLDKGLIFNVDKYGMNNITLFPNSNTLILRSDKEEEDNFYSFILLLLQYLNSSSLFSPNLISYAEKQGSFKISSSIPKKMLEDDAYYEFGGVKYTVKDSYDSIDFMRKNIKINNGKATKEEFESYITGDLIEFMENNSIFDGYRETPITLFGTITNLKQLKSMKNLKGIIDNEEAQRVYKKKLNEMYDKYKEDFKVNNKNAIIKND